MARYKGNHYSTDSEKHQKAVEKSRQTILNKFGVEGYSKFRSDLVKEKYALEAARLDKADIVEKDSVVKFLKEYSSDHFKGRAGNRTMKKLDLSMYKSLMYHTDEFSAFYNNRPIPFSGRIDIALKGFELKEDDLCYCGSRIKFDPKTQDWTKQYCLVCKSTGGLTSEEKGCKWLPEWTDEWEVKWKPRMVQNNCIMRGANEKELLDDVERKQSIIIDRDFKVLRYMPDGYCRSNNTIYEVYERHHKYAVHKEYDIKRQQIIQDYLKCDFCIIWDDGSNKVELHKYV